MTLSEYKQIISSNIIPKKIPNSLMALLYDARGEWERAHGIAQSIPGQEGAWIHAYLHRKEGDSGNAFYWYSRAGKPFSKLSFQDEWMQIAITFLSDV